MSPALYAPFFAAGLLVGTLLCLELGRRVGLRRATELGEKAHVGLGAVEGAVFGLLGLLIAFSFSGAMSRFDERRHLVVNEANAIGTAWLRLDLLPATTQPELRELFRRYLDSHLEIYRRLPDAAGATAARVECERLESEIWRRTVAAAQVAEKPQPAMLAIAAVNEMIDLASSESMATQIHPPSIIFIMLGLLALEGSFLAGYAMAGARSRHWIHIVSFAVLIAVTVYVILDIEYPLLGVIKIDQVTRALSELRQSMGT